VVAARSAFAALAAIATAAALATFASRLPFTGCRRTITFRQRHCRCLDYGCLTLWCRLGRTLFALAVAVARRTLLAFGALALFAAFAAVAAAIVALLTTGRLTFRLYRCRPFLAGLLFAAFLRLAVLASFTTLAWLAPLFVAIAPISPRLIAPATAIAFAARRGFLFRLGCWRALEQVQKTAPQ
jgi:hypothetical protein